MNPFISFCLYVAARVFVQYLKPRPNDSQVRSSLQFLLSAMHAIKRKNPLTESFLVQLDVDLEGAGLGNARAMRGQAQGSTAPNRSPGYSHEHQAMHTESGADRCGATYGDQGLLRFNDPIIKAQAGDSTAGLSAESPPVELPSRGKVTRGVFPGGALLKNTQGESIMIDLDNSPEGSGSSRDYRTPSSATTSGHNNSSQASHTGYSPQNQQQTDQHRQPGYVGSLFSNDATIVFGSDFDMMNFPSASAEPQQAGFSEPPMWKNGGTGFTPGAATGFTPGPSGTTPGTNDLMNMTEADWSEMMDGMTGWNESSGLDQGMNAWAQQGRAS